MIKQVVLVVQSFTDCMVEFCTSQSLFPDCKHPDSLAGYKIGIIGLVFLEWSQIGSLQVTRIISKDSENKACRSLIMNCVTLIWFTMLKNWSHDHLWSHAEVRISYQTIISYYPQVLYYAIYSLSHISVI